MAGHDNGGPTVRQVISTLEAMMREHEEARVHMPAMAERIGIAPIAAMKAVEHNRERAEALGYAIVLCEVAEARWATEAAKI